MLTAARLKSFAACMLLVIGAVGAGQVAGLVASGHKAIPLSVQLLALVFGCINALFAVGIVLIYRASRVINFAQAGIGGISAVVVFILVREQGLPWWLAMIAGLALSALIGLVLEVFLVRRFFNSSRLVLTVVTIAVGQLLAGLAGIIPTLWLGPDALPSLSGRLATPFSNIKIDLFPVIITGDHLVLIFVTLVILGAMTLFFRYTSVGIAVRGAAENDDRAQLLGVNTRTISSIVWVIAGLLSGFAFLLQVPITGLAIGTATGIGSGLLLRALAAAVVGRMENIPLTVCAALGLQIFESSVFFAFSQTSIVDLAVLAVILGGLLVQRKQLARAEDTGGTWSATDEIRSTPKELAGIPSVRKGARVVGGVVAVFLLAYPWVASPGQTNLGSLFAIYGIVAVSLVILIGWGGQISLGQFGFVAVGALMGGAMTAKWHWPFLVALVAASLVGSAVAVLLGLPALRIRGLFLAVTTLAFAVVCATVLLNPRYFGFLIPHVVTRPKFFFINTEDERAYYYLCVLGLAFAVFAAQGLRRSRTGRVLIAMRDNSRAAQSFGVNLVRTRLATFALSGFIASFAGVLFAHHQHSVSPTAFPPDMSIQMFAMSVIGGLGSVTGVLTGPLYIGFANIVITNSFGQLLAGALGLLLLLLFFPGGLGALAYSMRDSFLRRVAIRNRIMVPSLLADYKVVEGELPRVPLAPKFNDTGGTVIIPRKYRLKSRIGLAGASQATRRWSF